MAVRDGVMMWLLAGCLGACAGPTSTDEATAPAVQRELGAGTCMASSDQYRCALACVEGALTRCGGREGLTYCGCYEERPDEMFPEPQAGKPALALIASASCSCEGGAATCRAECDPGQIPVCSCESDPRRCNCKAPADSPTPYLVGPGDR